MDERLIIYIVLGAFWLLSRLGPFLKKQMAERTSVPSPPKVRTRLPASPPPVSARAPGGATSAERAARAAIESLERFEAGLSTGLADLDERVRAQVAALVERGLGEELDRARRAIDSALSANDSARVREETAKLRQLLAGYQGLLKTAGMLSAARRRPDTLAPQRVADRLLDEIDAPLRSFARVALLEIPGAPPVAVLADPKSHQALRSSSLGSSIVLVPRSVLADPLHWSLLSHEVAGYLSGIAPGLYPEIWERLALRVTDRDVATRPEALARLLFGSYLVRIVGDAVGATLFGPSYARALARLYAEPGTPSRVTTVFLNKDRTVHPEPPAHLRIHLVVFWLMQLGLGSEAEEIRRQWDEAHGYPAAFAIQGTMTTTPADVLVDTGTALMAELEELELQSFSSRTLASLPGIADWSLHRREASDAKARFLSGSPASGRARALIAAAMDAAVEAPGLSATIRNALYASVAPEAARSMDHASPASTRESGGALFPPRRSELVEALLLGEVLLNPRRYR